MAKLAFLGGQIATSLYVATGIGISTGFVGYGLIGAAAYAGGAALLGGALATRQTVKNQGPRLESSQVLGSAEGAPLLSVFNRMRVGGQLIWATTFREVRDVDRDSVGRGKNKTTVENVTYRYYASFAIALCAADGNVTLGRVWADGKLLNLSDFTYRFYDGDPSQMPDPKIQSVEGIDVTPAYRGTAYIVFEEALLENFGNRIPQITCEVTRASPLRSNDAMENSLRAVNIIPGSGEFVYGTEPYASSDGVGGSMTENQQNSTGDPNFVASLDRLESFLPNVQSASLVVSWFGDSLDATSCSVRPKVDSASKSTVPSQWSVAGLTRDNAQLVTSYGGGPAYGGTPSDQTVREAVIEMKARGLRVLFYPFLLMDMTDYPWRGRIEGDPSAFLGSAAPSDFARNADGSVTYSGVEEWTHRRMILHYATLIGDLLEPGDAFLVGTEMVGLSASQTAWGTGIASLMADVRSKLGAGVLVSYAADWSEYKHTSLAPVWASADFIGLDWYLPLTDWRTSDDKVYTLAEFEAGVRGGEYWDWYYASDEDRDAQIRTPITDPAHRQKDVGYWRDANYAGKPIWLTEFGCPAVDNGSNQPNVFPDPKSIDGATPHYSTGLRNDTVQRLHIEAMLTSFDAADPANMFLWAWDARPYPAFPYRSDVWADAPLWETGHWITGRVGQSALGDIIRELCLDVGYDETKIDVSSLAGIAVGIRGFWDDSLSSPATLLQNLMQTFQIDTYEDAGKIVFVPRSESVEFEIDEGDFVDDEDKQTFVATRTRDVDLPDRVKVEFVDDTRDYATAAVDSHSVTGASDRVESFSAQVVLDQAFARSLADSMVHEAHVARNRVTFTLPFSSESSGVTYLGIVKPGRSFRFRDRLYRVRRVSYGDDIEVEAVGYNPNVYAAVDHASGAPSVDVGAVYGQSLVEFMDIPLLSSDALEPWSPRIAARQEPWPGAIGIYRDNGSGGYDLNSAVNVDAEMGETITDLPTGTPWVWDSTSELTVRMYGDVTLISASEASVLNGANKMLIETPSGEWEVFQFVNATLNEDGTYTLSKLLRGQLGTEPYMGNPTPTGARVVVYDQRRLGNLEGGPNLLGVDLNLRYGPGPVDVADARYLDATVTPRGVAYRPYAPAHLRQDRSGSDLILSWVRRTRFDGDSWAQTEVPLNEEYERYEIDVLDGETVVRTLVVDNASAVTYTAAQQVADFGSTQDSVLWRVYQMSATFGRGAPATS